MSSIPQSRAGFVYMIQMGDTDYYKIGISCLGIEQRLNALQTASPFELKLIASEYQEDARLIERAIHLALKHVQARNEWFHGEQSAIHKVFIAYNAMAKIDMLMADGDLPNEPEDENDIVRVSLDLDVTHRSHAAEHQAKIALLAELRGRMSREAARTYLAPRGITFENKDWTEAGELSAPSAAS